MKKTIALLLAVVMVVALLAGCGGKTSTETTNNAPAANNSSSDNASAPADNAGASDAGESTTAPAETTAAVKDFRVGMYSEPATLDPSAVSLSATNCTVMGVVFATLFDYDSSTGEYVNYIANGYEWVDDLTLKITIRDDVVTHSGAKITADDVAFCLNRGTENPALANTYQYFVPDSFEVVDPTTVTVKMTTINYGAWQTLGLGVCAIYAKSDFEAAGSPEAFARNPVGCGPYVFDHWEAGSEIVVKKNDNFWGDEPVFDTITFKFIPDANARTLALQSGDIDFAENIGASLAPTIEGMDGISLYNSDVGETQMIWFNCLDNEALKNPDVRKALEYATNKEAVLYTIYNGVGAVSDSIFTASSAQYRAPKEDRSYNPEKAKEMLAAAGYGSGLTLELSCYESTDYQTLLAMLQQQWSEVGVTCNITTFDKGAFFEKLYGGQFDSYTIHNVGLDPSIRCINYRSNLSRADGNLTGFANPDYDKLVNDSFTAKTPAERDALLMDAADLLRDACPFFSIVDTYILNAGVDGIQHADNGPTSYMLYYHFSF